MLRGERTKSAPLRTAENRPRRETEEHHPLQSDRLGVEEARERERRIEHAAAHQRQAVGLAAFSHPACEALPAEARETCPLTDLPWRVARETPRGLELRADRGETDPEMLRWKLLCHIAWGREHPEAAEDECPLHVPGVGVTVLQMDRELLLRVETDRPAEVEKLRERLRSAAGSPR